MPVQVSHPGVSVQEVSAGVRTITGVSTSIAAFIGMAKCGRLGVPTRIQSFADYERMFGTDTVLSEMTDQVHQFFLNGGQQAWITRIGAKAASVHVLDARRMGPVLTVTAKDAGRDGNQFRIAVDYDTQSPESTFNLTVFRDVVNTAGNLESERPPERFSNLSMNPSDERFVENIVNLQSTLVDVERVVGLEARTPPFAGYSLSGILIREEADVDPDDILAIDGTAETITITGDRRLAYPDGAVITVAGSAVVSNNATFIVTSTSFSSTDTVISLAGALTTEESVGATVRAVPTAAADINAILNAGQNTLQISVDGGPFRTIVLPPLNPVTDPVDFSAWQTVLTAAFPGPGGTVSLTDPLTADGAPKFKYLQFRSTNAVGGSVVIRRALTNDLTVPLQLGVEQGGLEVDGRANQRPAPTGFFADLGDLSAASGPLVLASFANAEHAALAEWTLTDASGQAYSGVPQPIAFPGTAGSRMYNGSQFTGTTPALVGSLRNVRQHFAFLGSAIEGAVRGTHGSWTAAMQGHRLVLTPTFGGVDSDTTAALTSNNPTAPLAAYNIGSDAEPFASTPEPASVQANVRAYSLGGPGTGFYQERGDRGDDGQFPQLADYTAVFPLIDRQVDLFNLLILPRATRQPDRMRQLVWGPASVFCQQRRAFLLIDPPSDNGAWSNVNEATASSPGGLNDLRSGLVNDHAAIYWPRLAIASNGATKLIDPSGSIAGVMARMDADRGVWKAPAGLEAIVRGGRGVEYRMSDPENGRLNQQAVNAIRLFPNGIVSWGARTMAGFDNSGNDDYKYVPVRRLALFIEESLVRGLKFVILEQNDASLWAQIRLAAGTFMHNLFQQGAFQGQRARDAYFVKVDSGTTTQNDINLGMVNVVVGFAPLRPAEFVIITIQQIAGQAQT